MQQIDDPNISQQALNLKTTSYQRQYDVMTSHRRRYDIVLTSCGCWDISLEDIYYLYKLVYRSIRNSQL